MSIWTILGVSALGGAGAMARFLVDGTVSTRLGRAFPLGTLAVNLSGSLTLGVLVGLTLGDDSMRLLGTGLIGGYTTFSTWAFESHRLAEDGEARLGAINFGVSLALGVGLAWLGREIGAAL
jgi:fluoride exporter